MTKITSTCTIAEHFAEIDDPRYQHSPPYALLDIITMALCGIICGADDWVAIEEFGCAKEAWFKTFLRLPLWYTITRYLQECFQQTSTSRHK